MNFEIIIIDDNMQSSDPFVRRLEKVFQDARVILFPDVRESLDYIFDNLSKKLIVFLDCKFDTGLQGIDGLKRIREKNVSALHRNDVRQLPAATACRRCHRDDKQQRHLFHQ